MAPLIVNNYKPSPVNDYKPGPRQHVSATNPWNFVLPVPESIEANRIKLVPFVPSVHAKPWQAAALQNPTLTQYIPFNIDTLENIHEIHTVIHDNPQHLLFAIIDKTRTAAKDGTATADGTMAGVIGALECMPGQLKMEIGMIMVFPDFQGTHVAKHAIGAMLKYWLDAPSQGGMGFRRVSWTAHPANGASVAIAEKMGFIKEGIKRWTWVLPEGKPGKDAADDRGVGKGRDSVLLSLCWDDWENGVREKVLKLIET
jgi:RimJ/RimL family protein N-acetyltransferase